MPVTSPIDSCRKLAQTCTAIPNTTLPNSPKVRFITSAVIRVYKLIAKVDAGIPAEGMGQSGKRLPRHDLLGGPPDADRSR